MARKLRTDAWLFGGTLMLLVVSMAFVYSASAARAQLQLDDAEYTSSARACGCCPACA